jgi:hypothetical protein
MLILLNDDLVDGSPGTKAKTPALKIAPRFPLKI